MYCGEFNGLVSNERCGGDVEEFFLDEWIYGVYGDWLMI